MKDQYYAHSRQGKPPREWQPLDEHLQNVAELARSFANDFDSGDWAYLAGSFTEHLAENTLFFLQKYCLLPIYFSSLDGYISYVKTQNGLS